MNEFEPFTNPFNYLDMIPEQTIEFIPAQYAFGTFTFNTRDRGTKTVNGIRIYLEDKLGTPLPAPDNFISSVLVEGIKHNVVTKYRGLHWIDIGPQKLVYQLKPLLANMIPSSMIFNLQAHSSAPRTHYSVSVTMIPF